MLGACSTLGGHWPGCQVVSSPVLAPAAPAVDDRTSRTVVLQTVAGLALEFAAAADVVAAG